MTLLLLANLSFFSQALAQALGSSKVIPVVASELVSAPCGSNAAGQRLLCVVFFWWFFPW